MWGIYIVSSVIVWNSRILVTLTLGIIAVSSTPSLFFFVFLLTCLYHRVICIYDYSGWANVMETIRIDMERYACSGFLEETMSHLSSEVHMVDQGCRKSSVLGSDT